MFDLALADAARPAKARILGLGLLPYSIGHEITLLSERNPLLFKSPSFEDLEPPAKAVAVTRAVYVCCSTWAELNFSPENWLRAKVFLWNDRRFVKAWKRRNRNPDYALAGQQWKEYRDEAFKFPAGPDKEAAEIHDDSIGAGGQGRGRMLGGSWLARLIAFLVQGRFYEALGYSTPFDVPICLGEHLHLSWLEDAGRARIENEDEREIKEKMNTIRESVRAES